LTAVLSLYCSSPNNHTQHEHAVRTNPADVSGSGNASTFRTAKLAWVASGVSGWVWSLFLANEIRKLKKQPQRSQTKENAKYEMQNEKWETSFSFFISH
jgi:hypothetical protein